MFTTFIKIKNDRDLNRDGCGLGLTISKLISNALGGNIVVSSEKGKGSTFEVHLPSDGPIGKAIDKVNFKHMI